MDALTDGSDARTTPTARFWVWTLCSPIAAAAAAISGALLAGPPGAGVALVLLAPIYAAGLSQEPAIRLMPAARRTVWVLTGLAIGVVAAIAAFYVFVLVVFSTMWG